MKSPAHYTEEEAAKRRDEVIRRMANTPPQPRVNPPDRPKKKQRPSAGDLVDRKPPSDDTDA